MVIQTLKQKSVNFKKEISMLYKIGLEPSEIDLLIDMKTKDAKYRNLEDSL